MNTELTELRKRVEAATGPDRVLDCLIWCATADSNFEYYGGECVLAVQGGFAARLEWSAMPHPTASIDAALALVERKLPGCWWEVGTLSNRRGIDPEDTVRAKIGAGELEQWPIAFAATAPLAILAALLAALEQTP